MEPPRAAAAARLLPLITAAAARKYTMAVSDPHPALAFAQRFFPVQGCADTPLQPSYLCNGTVTCATVGRTNLVPQGVEDAAYPFMFPHMVNATARPAGPMQVPEVEAYFDEKLSAMEVYDQFMDFALVVYSPDLGTWLRKWEEGGVRFFPISWHDDTGAAYWSAIVRIPGTQVTVEVVSAVRPADDELAAPVRWRSDDLVRLPHAVFAARKTAGAKPGKWLPIAVSKFAGDLDAVADFYAGVLAGEAVFNATAAGGARMSVFWWPENLHVRVIERAGNTTGALTASGLERAKFRAHNMTLGRTFEESGLCGATKWMDNHWRLGVTTTSFRRRPDYASVLAALRVRDYRYFKLWATSGSPAPNMYVVDPTGDAVQFESFLGWAPDRPPEWATRAAPMYFCKGGTLGVNASQCVGGLCTQGDCAAATAAPCAEALRRECPGLRSGPLSPALSRCTDCVYSDAAFAALTSPESGCANADLWQYCVSNATGGG